MTCPAALVCMMLRVCVQLCIGFVFSVCTHTSSINSCVTFFFFTIPHQYCLIPVTVVNFSYVCLIKLMFVSCHLILPKVIFSETKIQ